MKMAKINGHPRFFEKYYLSNLYTLTLLRADRNLGAKYQIFFNLSCHWYLCSVKFRAAINGD